MATERLMSHEAYVIEKASNGIVVRPHAGWYHDERSRSFGVADLLVFNKQDDFNAWVKKWFPVEEPSL